MLRLNPAAVAGCHALLFCSRRGRAEAAPCRSETFEAASYTVCSFDLAKADLRLFWRKPDGDALRHVLGARRRTGRAGDHAAIRHERRHVRRRSQPDRPLRRERDRDARGQHGHGDGRAGQIPNFYKKPNGVFYVHGEEAGVASTDAFLSDRPAADFATQSGPMLVIEGAIHPAFIVDSTDRKPRNGVGVTSPTRCISSSPRAG